MVLRGLDDVTTRLVCGYNPCHSAKKAARSSYEQQRRYFITKEKDCTCPRRRFRDDLVNQLILWRKQGERLIVCMDVNEDIYRQSIGKALTDTEDLDMTEAVGSFTGKTVGPTFFRGNKPIDGVWVTSDIVITGACVMPSGYGIGDHRLFVVDFLTSSLVGHDPPKIVRAAARRLNTQIPSAERMYVHKFEDLIIEHKIVERVGQANNKATSKASLKIKLDVIDKEQQDYMLNAEKKLQKNQVWTNSFLSRVDKMD